MVEDAGGIAAYTREPTDFILGAAIGSGMTGQVHSAQDKRTGETVAVKFPTWTSIEEDVRKNTMSFLREILVPVSTRIPRLVRLVGFCPPTGPDPRPMIVTQYMPNGSLDKLIEKRFRGMETPGFGPTQLSKAVFAIAVTLARLHHRGMVHRDIKPSNVLFDEHFEIVIADFGLAKFLDPGVRQTLGVGTPLYAAPEMADDDYGQEVDVFAFAVLLYQMFTARTEMGPAVHEPGKVAQDKPRVLKSAAAVMMKINEGWRLVYRPEIPPEFWELITRCWADSPHDRPTFPEIVEVLMRSEKFAFAGTDMRQFLEYRAALWEEFTAEFNQLRRNTSPGEGGDFTIRRLASNGVVWAVRQERLSNERMVGSSPVPGRNIGRGRYDFTRRSKREL
jgi:serine/threonine protein kinase